MNLQLIQIQYSVSRVNKPDYYVCNFNSEFVSEMKLGDDR